MLMIIELGTQHIEAKAKVAYLRSNGIVNQNLAFAYVVAVVAENGRYPPTPNGDIRSLFMLFTLLAMQN